MSVLIKGMEMPKCCAGCKILCDAKSKTGLIRPFGERLQTCPLVEIPPHGRLIDADALVNDCEKYIKSLNHDRDGKEIAKIRWLVGILNEQPTIIEAEGRKSLFARGEKLEGYHLRLTESSLRDLRSATKTIARVSALKEIKCGVIEKTCLIRSIMWQEKPIMVTKVRTKDDSRRSKGGYHGGSDRVVADTDNF